MGSNFDIAAVDHSMHRWPSWLESFGVVVAVVVVDYRTQVVADAGMPLELDLPSK